MFFIFSKILSFAVTPVVWIFTLLCLTILTKNEKRRKKLLLLTVAMFYFFSNAFILDEFERLWEIPAVPYSQVQGIETGVVLGGILYYDESLDRIQFIRGSDRLWQAVELYKMGKIRKLFFTGGSGSLTYKNHKEGPLVKRYLNTLGIPEQDVIVESESKNTRENVIFSKKMILENSGGTNILLITSGLHMRRSLACFKKEGINALPYSVDRYCGPRKFAVDHAFIPSGETLFSWNNLIHEWIGYLTYKLLGYA